MGMDGFVEVVTNPRKGKPYCCACCVVLVLTALVFLVLILAGIKNLSEEEQLLVIKNDGRSVTDGPAGTWVWIGQRWEIRPIHLLSQTQYVIVEDLKTGLKRVQKGPGRFFLKPYEKVTGDKQEAAQLTAEEYMYVTDKLTGEITTVRGPALYFPAHAHQLLGEDHDMIRLLEYEAMVVREPGGTFSYHHGSTADKNTGILAPEAEVVEFTWSNGVDMESNNTFKTFSKIDTRIQQLPFFFDDIRSKDNMEFELEGVIFWQVSNVQMMMRNTKDPTSDVWHRLRSRLAEASTAHSFLGFLENASSVKSNMIADELANHGAFYTDRGLTLHSMQLIEVELHSDELAKEISDRVAEAATKRLNDIEKATTEHQLELANLQAQHQKAAQEVDNALELETKTAEKNIQQTTNEAALAALVERTRAENALTAARNEAILKATQQNNSHNLRMTEVETEKLYETQRLVLLDLLEVNSRKEAESKGSASGVQLGKTVAEYLQSLNVTVPDLADRVNLYKLHQETDSKIKTTANLAGGTAQLYVTPETVNLHLGGSNRTDL